MEGRREQKEEKEEEVEQRVLDESETCTPESTKALWSLGRSKQQLQFTGLPRSVYFVSLLMEWSRFRTVALPFSPSIRANYDDCPGIKVRQLLMAILRRNTVWVN
ncbi:hypothetical protein K0M31_010050 [Melipona bicolor]|uniref:Uncharacterized protein n=1 Tax=Melipona bicolor TaxID=60889 RepID=A0AA40FM48_9HYME|nr:hypothetical protein K0M31_010050 [Melipona bicolor]